MEFRQRFKGHDRRDQVEGDPDFDPNRRASDVTRQGYRVASTWNATRSAPDSRDPEGCLRVLDHHVRIEERTCARTQRSDHRGRVDKERHELAVRDVDVEAIDAGAHQSLGAATEVQLITEVSDANSRTSPSGRSRAVRAATPSGSYTRHPALRFPASRVYRARTSSAACWGRGSAAMRNGGAQADHDFVDRPPVQNRRRLDSGSGC